MLSNSCQAAVMAAHYAEALQEGLAVVPCGHALRQIVRKHHTCVEQGQSLLLGILHDAYAPVEIAAKTVA